MTIKKILYIFGTRPEAIKLAPLIARTKHNGIESIVCITGQHNEMLYQVLDFFKIKPDFDLKIMRANQDLYDVTSSALIGLRPIIKETKPDIIIVQGDTASCFVGALAGYYSQIPVAHVEAGLRSGNKFSPFPEEIFRKLVADIADYHFAPTAVAAASLKEENIKSNVYMTTNTVIDALFLGLNIIASSGIDYTKDFSCDFNKKIILITCHRRETFGKPLIEICQALKHLAIKFPDTEFVYPVHLNPNVKNVVEKELGDINNFYLIPPLDYARLIWLMEKSYFVITDSGGIQEEAPSLNKPILVTREVTERMEGVDSGCAKLVGYDQAKIIAETSNLLNDERYYASMACVQNPYGDGKACERITEILQTIY